MYEVFKVMVDQLEAYGVIEGLTLSNAYGGINIIINDEKYSVSIMKEAKKGDFV